MIREKIDDFAIEYIYDSTFGQITLPARITGTLIASSDMRGGLSDDYRWRFESDDDMRLARMPQPSEIANISDHYLVRQLKDERVYLKCFQCMDRPISYLPEHERLIHGYFYDHECEYSIERLYPEVAKRLKGEAGEEEP